MCLFSQITNKKGQLKELAFFRKRTYDL